MKKLIATVLIVIFLIPLSTKAARLHTIGNELNTFTAGVEYTSTTGAVSTSTSIVPPGSGTYSVRVTGGTGAFRSRVRSSDSNNDIGFVSKRLYIAAAPNNLTKILCFETVASVDAGCIRMAADRTMGVYAVTGVQVGATSSAIDLNSWYVIQLMSDPSSNTMEANYQKGGQTASTTFGSGTFSPGIASWGQISWGNIDGTQTTNDMYFDDIKVNDKNTISFCSGSCPGGSAVETYPGTGHVIYLRPNGMGDSNQWKKSSGGAGDSSNYQDMDEITPDDSTTFLRSDTNNAQDLYNMTDTNIGGSTTTIKAVQVNHRFSGETGGVDQFDTYKVIAKKTSSGTTASSTDLFTEDDNWDTDQEQANDPQIPQLSMPVDPDNQVWTIGTLNSMQAGMKHINHDIDDVFFTAIWVAVDYIPASTTPPQIVNGGKQNINGGKLIISH